MKLANVLLLSMVFLSSSSFAATPKQLAKLITEFRVGLKAKVPPKLITESSKASAFVNDLARGNKVWSKLGENTRMGQVFISVESTPQIIFIRSAAARGKYSHDTYVKALSDELYKLNSDLKNYHYPNRVKALGESVIETASSGKDYSVIVFNMSESNLRQLDLFDFEETITSIAQKVKTAN